VGFNILGALGRALVPVFYVLANQLYGPEVFGLYALAWAPAEILTMFVVVGFSDALQRFAARDPSCCEPGDLQYAVMWRCLGLVLAASVAAIALVVLAGPTVTTAVWGRPELASVLLIFALNVPLVGVLTILLAGARAVMDMKGDALVRGLVLPVLLPIGAVVIHPFLPTVLGLGLTITFSNLVGVVAAAWYFRKHYSLGRLWAARALPTPPGLLGFAFTQSLNLTFWQALWNLDVLVLGAYRSDAEIGLYRTAAELGRLVFSIRLSFSGVYAPLVARYSLENDLSGIQDSYLRLSRWIATIASPVVAALILFQTSILWLFNPSYAGGATFLWMLLVGPLVACTTGLSGNILVMSGQNRWNLANSALLLGVNAILAMTLIPHYGMTGASLATMIATTAVSLLQVVQVRRLLGIRFEVGRVWKPFLAAAVAAAAAALGSLLPLPATPRLVVQVVVFIGGYAALLGALGLEAEDRALFRRPSRRGEGADGGGG
jgi:O-antigen/teichoic acid export membrane protein